MVSQGWSPDVLRSMGIFPTTPEQQAGIDAFNAAISANLKKTAAEMGLDLGTDLGAPVTPKTYTPEEIKKINADAAAAEAAVVKTMAENEAKQKAARETNYNTVRSELENQYNNLVQLDPNAAYKGRASDLPAIFNQQAAQLADDGVTSITNLKIQDGKLVDSSTGKIVSTSNLRGQVYVDRDTGVQKWGDIFSGVEGGANYGIQALDDGSVVLFPAWEKSKSLTSQVLGSDLFKVASIGLAAYGLYNLGTTLATAGGASTISAAGTGLTPGAAGVTGLTPGAAGVTGIVAPAGTTLAPSVGATVGGAAGASGGFGLLDGTDFSRIGETGLIPGSAGEGIQVVVPPGGGAATIPGLEAPGLSAMGGAQGITVPIQGGGVVSEMGFVPPGATPSLGDPGSFINNPDYLGSPVISEDYLGLTASDMPTGIGIQDALRMARTGMQLFGGQQQQGLLGGGGTAPYQAQGVDYSGLLSLLQGKARTPGVSPLIAPVASFVARPYEPLLGQQPQYQSLLGRTQQSLLG